MNKTAFTLVELLISSAVMAILAGTVVFVYLACLSSWDAGDRRASTRMELSQAMELMVKQLRRATEITSLSGQKVTFKADLGDGAGAKEYRFVLNTISYRLLKGLAADPADTGGTIAARIQPSATTVFSQSGNVITIDLSADNAGSVVHVRSKVRPRNL